MVCMIIKSSHPTLVPLENVRILGKYHISLAALAPSHHYCSMPRVRSGSFLSWTQVLHLAKPSSSAAVSRIGWALPRSRRPWSRRLPKIKLRWCSKASASWRELHLHLHSGLLRGRLGAASRNASWILQNKRSGIWEQSHCPRAATGSLAVAPARCGTYWHRCWTAPHNSYCRKSSFQREIQVAELNFDHCVVHKCSPSGEF